MPCPICNSPTTYYRESGDRIELTCVRCGSFTISGRAAGSLRGGLTNAQIGNISYWIRRNSELTILTTDIENLKKLPTPTVGEKARRLIIYLSQKYPLPGQRIELNSEEASNYSIPGCFDLAEFNFVFDNYLIKTKKYMVVENGRLLISPEGWSYIESLKETNPESHICFIAMRFSERFNPLYDNAIMPAVIDSGYEPIRLDRTEHNNPIDDEIIAQIKVSKFIVADLTEQNQGVYFEAGYALGLGLQVIWLCKEEDLEHIHFDNRQYNFLTWNDDEFQDLRIKLKNRIIATIGKGSYNPQVA